MTKLKNYTVGELIVAMCCLVAANVTSMFGIWLNYATVRGALGEDFFALCAAWSLGQHTLDAYVKFAPIGITACVVVFVITGIFGYKVIKALEHKLK